MKIVQSNSGETSGKKPHSFNKGTDHVGELPFGLNKGEAVIPKNKLPEMSNAFRNVNCRKKSCIGRRFPSRNGTKK